MPNIFRDVYLFLTGKGKLGKQKRDVVLEQRLRAGQLGVAYRPSHGWPPVHHY